MVTLKVTREDVRRAKERVMKGEVSCRVRQTFVPTYKLPVFEYDEEKVRNAFSRALAKRS